MNIDFGVKRYFTASTNNATTGIPENKFLRQTKFNAPIDFAAFIVPMYNIAHRPKLDVIPVKIQR